jgi:hypothetical protein
LRKKQIDQRAVVDVAIRRPPRPAHVQQKGMEPGRAERRIPVDSQPLGTNWYGSAFYVGSLDARRTCPRFMTS